MKTDTKDQEKLEGFRENIKQIDGVMNTVIF
jgi:hypothetical protein